LKDPKAQALDPRQDDPRQDDAADQDGDENSSEYDEEVDMARNTCTGRSGKSVPGPTGTNRRVDNAGV
jgi:hypothetical protein